LYQRLSQLILHIDSLCNKNCMSSGQSLDIDGCA
jgi:hypothetical protein